MKTHYFIGHSAGKKTLFKCASLPTSTDYPDYLAVVGPFKTKRAALWALAQANNPHFQHVNDAEKLSKII